MNRLIKIASEWLSKFDYWRPRKTLAEDYQNVNGFSKHGVLQFLFLSRSSIEWAYFEMLMKKPTVIKMLNAQEISCNEYRESKAKKKKYTLPHILELRYNIFCGLFVDFLRLHRNPDRGQPSEALWNAWCTANWNRLCNSTDARMQV